MNDVKTYSYKPKFFPTALSGAFFAVCAVIMFQTALTNDRGATLFHRLIELGPQDATILYWFLFVCSVGFVLTALLAVHKSLTSDDCISLTEAELIIPGIILSPQEVRIRLSDIEAINDEKIGRQRMLSLWVGAKKRRLVAALFENKKTYEEFIDTLTTSVQKDRLKNNTRQV